MLRTTFRFVVFCFRFYAGASSQTENVAAQVVRIGPQHQAGSDSLLTCATFFKMRNVFFEDKIDDIKYKNQLYGLGATFANGS